MANTLKSSLNNDLILTLPATVSAQAERINVTNFTVEGTAVEYGFVDTNRLNEKLGADGSGEAFINPNRLVYIEFTIVPFSDIDNKLSNFTFDSPIEALIVLFKDYDSNIKFTSDKAFFKVVNPRQKAANPDYKTYRITLIDYVKGAIQ
jgi:hypothetical protein